MSRTTYKIVIIENYTSSSYVVYKKIHNTLKINKIKNQTDPSKKKSNWLYFCVKKRKKIKSNSVNWYGLFVKILKLYEPKFGVLI